VIEGWKPFLYNRSSAATAINERSNALTRVPSGLDERPSALVLDASKRIHLVNLLNKARPVFSESLVGLNKLEKIPYVG